MRGFLRGVSGATVALVFVVIAVGLIENDRLALAFAVLFLVVDRSAVSLIVDRCAITFIKDRIGNHVLFAGPVAQVPQTASLAAEGKIRVYRRIGRRFANRTFVHHDRFVFSGLNLVINVIPSVAGPLLFPLHSCEGWACEVEESLFASAENQGIPSTRINPRNDVSVRVYPKTRSGAPVAMRCSFSAGSADGIESAASLVRAVERGRISTTRPMRS